MNHATRTARSARRTTVLTVALLTLLCSSLVLAHHRPGHGGGGGGGGEGGGGGGGEGGLPAAPNIAYIDTFKNNDIVLFDTHSGEYGTLLPDAQAWFLAWSPDGSEIAYVRADHYTSDNHEIRIVSADGSGNDRLVIEVPGKRIRGLDWSPSPTPNGRHMLIYSTYYAEEIFAVATDGTENTLLATGYIYPTWSPDGGRFVASAGQSADPPRPVDVFTIDMIDDGLSVVDQYPITATGDNPIIHTDSISKAWSNSGNWIAVMSKEIPSFDGDLWLVDPDDPTIYQRLTNNPEWEMYPSFDALDERIYFMNDEGWDDLYSIDAVVGGDWVLESDRKQKYLWRPVARRDLP